MNEDPRTASELAATYESQIKGKIVLTTGVSPGGLGAAFVLGIAQSQPALLILAGRNLAKVQQTADAISATGVKVRILELDLISLASVRTSAEKVNSWDDVPQVDVLVNNAGVVCNM